MAGDSHIESAPADTDYGEQELAKLARKERLLQAVAALALFDYSTDPKTIEKTKRRVQTIFWRRYH